MSKKKTKKIKRLFLNFSLILLLFLFLPINIVMAHQCQSDDDCPPGEFCAKFPDSNIPNTCIKKSSPGPDTPIEEYGDAYISDMDIVPQVTIPGSTFIAGKESEIKEGTTTIGEYIESIYTYLLLIVGIIAAIVLMAAGILWLSAGGNTERIGQAKKLITGSLTGLVLMLTSYILLVTINPNLVDFKIAGIGKIDPETSGKYLCSWNVSTDAEVKCEDWGAIEGDTWNIGQDIINNIISGEGEIWTGLSKEEKMKEIKKIRIKMCPPSKPSTQHATVKCCCPSYIESPDPPLTDALIIELETIEKRLESGTPPQPKPQEDKDEDDNIIFTPQVTIDDKFQKEVGTPIEEGTRTIAEYIRSIYQYMLAVVGLLAVVILMISGVVWLTAGGNTERIGQAKNFMTGSLTGLVLMLTSYIILRTVNPDLVEFKITEIDKIETMTHYCCKVGDTAKDVLKASECEDLGGKLWGSIQQSYGAWEGECHKWEDVPICCQCGWSCTEERSGGITFFDWGCLRYSCDHIPRKDCLSWCQGLQRSVITIPLVANMYRVKEFSSETFKCVEDSTGVGLLDRSYCKPK